MRRADPSLALDRHAGGPAAGAQPGSQRLAPDRPRALRFLRRLRGAGQRSTTLVGQAGLRPGARPPLGPGAAQGTSVLLRDVSGRKALVVGEYLRVSGHRDRLSGGPNAELPRRGSLGRRRGGRRLPAPIPRERAPTVVVGTTRSLQRSLSGRRGARGGPRPVPAVLEFTGAGGHRARGRAQDAGRRVDRAVATPLRAAAPAGAGGTRQRNSDRPAARRSRRGRGLVRRETPSSLM